MAFTTMSCTSWPASSFCATTPSCFKTLAYGGNSLDDAQAPLPRQPGL